MISFFPILLVEADLNKSFFASFNISEIASKLFVKGFFVFMSRLCKRGGSVCSVMYDCEPFYLNDLICQPLTPYRTAARMDFEEPYDYIFFLRDLSLSSTKTNSRISFGFNLTVPK